MQKTLTSTALEGIRWNYIGFVSRSITALIVGMVLARLLGPKPFGQIGVATIVFGLGNLLVDAGFSSALVQAPELHERQIRSAFTMQAVFGCTMTVFVWLLAPAVANAFHDPAVVSVVRGVSPLFFFQSLGQTAAGLLRRQLRFRNIQAAQIISYLLGYAVVGVTMAYAGYGVWSLVAAQLTQPFLYSALVYARVRHPLRPYIDRSDLRLLRFGAQVTGANLINWGISNLDNIFVGRAFGSTSLGLYSRSYNLANVPVEGFVNTCQQVLFASCSRVDQRFDRMRRAYLAAVSGVALITMPILWSLAVCGRFVVEVMYGPSWKDGAPLFSAFAVAMPFFALMALAGPVLNAADLVNQEIRTQAISLAFSFVLFAAASQVSLVAVACSVPFAYAFRFWCTTRPTLKLLGLHWRDLATVVSGPVVAGAFTAVCVFAASRADLIHKGAPAVMMMGLAVVGLVSLVLITYVGGNRIVPAALAELLIARSGNIPSWAAQLLQPFFVRLEPELPPVI